MVIAVLFAGSSPAHADGPTFSPRRAPELTEPVLVLPENPTAIELSNRDINRITCGGHRPVKDLIFSEEKGIIEKKSGENVYIKFLVQKDGSGTKRYRSEQAEIFVLCGAEATNYTMIVSPKDIDARHVILAGPKDNVKKNLSLFEGMDFEKKIMAIMQQGYNADYPDSYAIVSVNDTLPSGVQGVTATLKTLVTIEGEGLILKEIILSHDPEDESQEPVEVEEKIFLNRDITLNPIGIALDHSSVVPGRDTRLFILEQSITS